MTVLNSLYCPARIQDASTRSVVLIGSLGANVSMWTPQLDALSERFHVLAVDHWGHGGQGYGVSPLPSDTSPSIAAFADDVLETASANGIDSFAVVGLSLGGTVAQYLAATSARVEKAVFISTSDNFGGPDSWLKKAADVRAKGTGSLAEATAKRWFSAGFGATHPAFMNGIRVMVAETPDEGYAACCEALGEWNFTDQLGQVTCDVLTIAGDEDAGTSPDVLARIAAHVGGNVRSEVISPAAHLLNMEHPQRVNQLLLEFLA
ncbi:alpha/beta fold hydrolase [Corynebacterium uterequi]|uniref:3-oxoadipate enol-lactonase n=1 Tax=Corynebacterium uterequi TaxID=1072256 RepID=A0A0G3HEY3_9CORY|nr:alpha/beta fold hydrolase [Corynebacterium uterequi]AKK11864.1 3-oxoadipate enol-lactonase [Corynebacterium uterequi]